MFLFYSKVRITNCNYLLGTPCILISKKFVSALKNHYSLYIIFQYQKSNRYLSQILRKQIVTIYSVHPVYFNYQSVRTWPSLVTGRGPKNRGKCSSRGTKRGDATNNGESMHREGRRKTEPIAALRASGSP